MSMLVAEAACILVMVRSVGRGMFISLVSDSETESANDVLHVGTTDRRQVPCALLVTKHRPAEPRQGELIDRSITLLVSLRRFAARLRAFRETEECQDFARHLEGKVRMRCSRRGYFFLFGADSRHFFYSTCRGDLDFGRMKEMRRTGILQDGGKDWACGGGGELGMLRLPL
jgi:hypothetical protein